MTANVPTTGIRWTAKHDLEIQLGSEGEPTEFQYLPAGGDGDPPPEVARLAFENAVEASATWSAIRGK